MLLAIKQPRPRARRPALGQGGNVNAVIRGVGQSVGATEVERRSTALLAAGALGLMIVGVAGFAHPCGP